MGMTPPTATPDLEALIRQLANDIQSIKGDVSAHRNQRIREQLRAFAEEVRDDARRELATLQASVREKLEAAFKAGIPCGQAGNGEWEYQGRWHQTLDEVMRPVIDRLLAAPEPPREGK